MGKVDIHYRLDRDRGVLVPGRGAAGDAVWTVDAADAADALRSLPRCAWTDGTVALARAFGLSVAR